VSASTLDLSADHIDGNLSSALEWLRRTFRG
jgi:hypothetical protein